MKIRSKLILSAVAATLGCALLAGCGGAASSSTASSASPAASSVVLSQAESALPDDGTNSPDALADEVDALLEANPYLQPVRDRCHEHRVRFRPEGGGCGQL